MLKSPEAVLASLKRAFDAHWPEWLDGGDWPLSIPMGSPSHDDWADDPEGVRRWIESWREGLPGCRVEWVERNGRLSGSQLLPARLCVDGPAEVARAVGAQAAWARCQAIFSRLTGAWPQAVEAVRGLMKALAAEEDADIDRLAAVVEWLREHPRSGLFRRAVPVRGIDSKWIENRIGNLSAIIRALRPETACQDGSDDLASLGLRAPPALIRWRLLDSGLRRTLGGIDSAATSLEDLATLTLPIERVLVIENLETGLSLPDLPGTLAILHRGYAVESLSEIPWLGRCRCGYWGDLDSHGFAILSRARGHIPDLRSIMMDRQTLHEFRDLCVFEPIPFRGELQSLSVEEADVFRGLRDNLWGANLRLEQERIPLDWAVPRLKGWADRTGLR